MLRFAITTALAVSAGCQLLVGIDNPPTSHATSVDARGVLEPIEVRLVSAEIDETIAIGTDGIAKFSSRVIEGDSYALSLVGTPACVLDDPAGVATADVQVTLICAGVTRLASLELSTATGMQPVLAPTVLAYQMAVSELQQQTTVSASAVDPDATIAVDGEPLAAATPSAPIALAPTSTTVTIAVDHPASPTLRSTYTVELTRSVTVAEHTYAKANPQQNDFFGQAVDVEGDLLVVGAVGESSLANPDDPSDQGAVRSGAAYLFERDAQGDWQRTGFLKAPNADADDLFGYSIAISGDRLIIGAPFESSASTTNTSDNSASHAGAAYVFRREGAQWVFEAYLKAPAPQVDARFGWDVALEGDRAVVGAPATNDLGTGSGEAFVFHRAGTTWTLEGALREDAVGQGGTGDGLGEAVAISNGFVAVTALRGEIVGTSVPNTGSVRIYQLVGATWTPVQELAPADLFLNAGFGTGVALSATHLVVGASAVAVANQAGAAYVFSLDGGSWIFEAKLVADTPTTGDEFGSVVDLAGDTIAVGAYREDGPGAGVDPANRSDTATDSGAVYLFQSAAPGAWTPRHYLKSSHPDNDDWFGFSLALSGDTLVVGSVGESSGSLTDPADDSVLSAGACLVFR